ncbi:MFS transporter [Poseidonocella sp. HB161398]|uniref:MFS transporter n=1 Tax=Poseidonocella sp. HB161398 TaxID=2320855 RepID=UPI001980E2F4|nr:MFS transporter [Poseidonocella sp. HB161398]
MPPALIALTIAAYATGTTEEFLIVGLLPTVATELGIALLLAGLIVSVYAFGAPKVTALTGRMPRKALLLGQMALFIAVNVLAALALSYPVLLAGRVLSVFTFNLGLAVGGWVGGLVVSPLSLGTTPLVGAALVALAFLATLRRARPAAPLSA